MGANNRNAYEYFFFYLKIICKNNLKMKAFLLETFIGITNQTTKFQVSS